MSHFRLDRNVTRRHLGPPPFTRRASVMKTARLMTVLACALLLSAHAFPQQESQHKSVHQLESEIHNRDIVTTVGDASRPAPLLPKTFSGHGAPISKVYGWHPYWASSNAYMSYDYSALTHIAYFSYETDTSTGSYLTVRGWGTSPIISYAHQRGVKVTLTVTNFGYDQNDKLLSDTLKQARMITELIGLLKSRNGDGVNFDLEMIRNTQRANLVSFMRRASTRIKAELPGAEISMATPAVDWSGTWDFAQLSRICDYLIVMGYDYYWSGSSTAGPVAPLEGESYNITRTINTYIAAGVPQERLLLGVPWFGHDWPVSTGGRKSPATGAASSRTYAVAEQMAISYGKVFDQTTKVPWIAYMSGTAWRQVWYDDSLSLALKYNLANARSLGGIGIWALGYENGRSEIWNGIKAAFVSTGIETPAGGYPRKFALLQNYPNPFNPTTTIAYAIGGAVAPSGISPEQRRGGEACPERSEGGLPRAEQRGPAAIAVRLAVYDLLGREVARLVNEKKEPGHYEVTFDATGLASGVYFCRIQSGEFIQSRRMVLIK